MSYMNKLATCKNPYQGDSKKVLAVCSAGLLRAPTVAWVLSQDPYNYNTRAVGITNEFALIGLEDNPVLLEWADEIVVVHHYIASQFMKLCPEYKHKLVELDIPDEYEFRNPKLVELIREQYNAAKGN